MSNNTAPSSKITLAWAIPVSAPQLGARLEAYVATKAAITTFRFGARNVTATALGDVPEEIIDMIAREVRNVVFKDDVKRWMKAFKCLTQKCSPMSHMTKSDISCWHECDEYGHHEDVLDAISEDWTERHNHKVEQWCTNLTNLDGTSRFSKCINVSVDSVFLVSLPMLKLPLS